MTHSLFRKEMFIETAFEKRFQAMLRSAWHKRCCQPLESAEI